MVAVPVMAADTPARWAGAWGSAPAGPWGGEKPQPPGTYRYRVTLGQAGSEVRLTFSNAEGDADVAITHASIGLPRGPSGIEVDPASVRKLSFSGKAGAAMPIGRTAITDALPFAAAVGRDVIVSVSFSTPTRPGGEGRPAPMGFAAVEQDSATAKFETVKVRPYLSLVAVKNPAAPCTIVAFGDSITDGYHAARTTAGSWPGRLADRLAALPVGRRCGVVNMGIGGNRVLRDGRADSALDRFWRDVASVPGVSHVILLEGINDIGNGGKDGNPVITPDMLIDGYKQVVARAHSLNIKVIGATLTPALSAGYMSPAKDRTRQAVNAFIRTGGAFDGVIDFDAATRDPAKPGDLRPDFDPGDHLHPNDAGNKAMGDAIDLSLFAPTRR